jgi:hypothetical protein
VAFKKQNKNKSEAELLLDQATSQLLKALKPKPTKPAKIPAKPEDSKQD